MTMSSLRGAKLSQRWLSMAIVRYSRVGARSRAGIAVTPSELAIAQTQRGRRPFPRADRPSAPVGARNGGAVDAQSSHAADVIAGGEAPGTDQQAKRARLRHA